MDVLNSRIPECAGRGTRNARECDEAGQKFELQVDDGRSKIVGFR